MGETPHNGRNAGAKHLIATLPHIFKIFQGPVSHMTIPLPGRNAAEPGKQKRKRLNSLADYMLNAFFSDRRKCFKDHTED